MPRFRSGIGFVCLSCTFVASPHLFSSQTVQTAVVRLDGGTEIARRLAGEQQDRYELALKAGDSARLTIVQRGVDVVVQTVAPDGRVLAEVNDEMRDRADEHVDVVADTNGTYRLIVKAAFARVASGEYTLHFDEIHPATSADRSLQDLRTLRAAYAPLVRDHRYSAARPLIERALALAEHARGPDDLRTAIEVRDLAYVVHRAHDYARAAALYERAAAVYEKALGPEHPATADVWTNLAATYVRLDQQPKAETLARRALDVSERALGPDHPQVALCLITLGNVRDDAGDLDRAEEFDRRALAIVEKTLGETLQTGVLLNNLGILLLEKQKFEQADEFFRRSLSIHEKNPGEDDLDVAATLQNLGVIARQRKDYAAAEDYCLRALSLRKKTLPPEHPDIAVTFNNLATVYRAKGDAAKALATHLQALAIWEKSVGPIGTGTLISLGNIARTYTAMGDLTHAVEFQRRADAVIEAQLSLDLVVGSERQKLAFVNSLADRIERTISLDADTHFTEPEATALAALVVLQRKGRVFDAMVDTLGSVRARVGTAADRDLFDQLRAATTELARIALSDPPNSAFDARLTAIAELEGRKERLEATLSEHSAEFRAQARTVTVEAVQAAIPRGAALVEFAVYRPFNARAERNSDAYGAPHYVAYVLTPGAAPRGRDLGPANAIDDLVHSFRGALRDPTREDVTSLARALDRLVLQPIRELLGVTTHLLISPDGELNLIPFEALRDEDERYAIERYSITYLSSGRDLLRMQVPRKTATEPIVVADPSYGEPAVAGPTRSAPTPLAGAKRRSATSVDEVSSVYFGPLAGTAEEARRIKTLFPDATVLTRERATKSALVHLRAPRMLHIATHGFFLQDTKHTIGNPLLRAGLALSGANLTSGNEHQKDGILTALEASNIDLWGTKLVTLSACDTGVGEVKNGEGVYGLRRAFFLAGAETVVMSYWPVSDYVTREMMTAYYGGLKEGLGRGEALRRAQLSILARKNRQHPFYWASFVHAGEWANLDGRR